jgi:hypothetical protein
MPLTCSLPRSTAQATEPRSSPVTAKRPAEQGTDGTAGMQVSGYVKGKPPTL